MRSWLRLTIVSVCLILVFANSNNACTMPVKHWAKEDGGSKRQKAKGIMQSNRQSLPLASEANSKEFIFKHLSQVAGSCRIAEISEDGDWLLVIRDDPTNARNHNTCRFVDTESGEEIVKISPRDERRIIRHVLPKHEGEFGVVSQGKPVRDSSAGKNWLTVSSIHPGMKEDELPHSSGIDWTHADDPKGAQWDIIKGFDLRQIDSSAHSIVVGRQSKTIAIWNRSMSEHGDLKALEVFYSSIMQHEPGSVQFSVSDANSLSLGVYCFGTPISLAVRGHSNQWIANPQSPQPEHQKYQVDFDEAWKRETYLANQKVLTSCDQTGFFVTHDRLSITLWTTDGVALTRLPFQASAACFVEQFSTILLADRNGGLYEWRGEGSPVKTLELGDVVNQLTPSLDGSKVAVRCSSTTHVLKAQSTASKQE